MSEPTRAFRDHLVRVLDWDDAHVTFDRAVEGIPADKRGARAAGFEHSSWQLLEHIRIAQEDILDFCINSAYAHAMRWPDDYWPRDPAPPGPAAWAESLEAFRRDGESLKQLVADPSLDLFAKIPHGTGQTCLREVLLVADHNSYHVGQLVLVRRLLGIWPAA